MQIRQPLRKIQFQAISQKLIKLESLKQCRLYGFHGQRIQQNISN